MSPETQMAFNLKETYRDNCPPPPGQLPSPPTIAPLRTTPPGLFPAADYCPPPRLLPPMTISCPREAVTVGGGE